MPCIFVRLCAVIRFTSLVVTCVIAGHCQVVVGQSPEADKNIGYGVAVTGPTGIYVYAPDKWGALRAQLINRLDKPQELISAVYFDGFPTIQYGRKIWLPARSRMQTWHPVRMPDIKLATNQGFGFHSLVMKPDNNNEVLIRVDSGGLQYDGVLPRSDEVVVTGLIRADDESQLNRDLAAVELITESRLHQGLSRRTTDLRDRILIPDEIFLEALHQLVIMDDHIMHDQAALDAIRRWIYSGGKVWVMLDLVDPHLLELLLGDEFPCEVVDTVSLTQVNVLSQGLGGDSERFSGEYDTPVNLVRVLVADVETAFTVDGWPAAFWKNYGEGQLLVTTLAAEGWMPPKNGIPVPSPVSNKEEVQQGIGGAPRSRVLKITNPMTSLAAEFLSRPDPKELAPEILEPIIQEYVGYTIPSRWTIASLLLALSSLLLIAGAGLLRFGKLEWMAVAGPCLALLTSFVFVMIGMGQRQAVPPTTASVQYLEAIAGTDDIRVHGMTGVYSPDAGEAVLGSTGGGILLPSMNGQEGTTRRLMWTDLDKWDWKNLSKPAGTSTLTFEQTRTISSPIRAKATLDRQGLTGKVFLPVNARMEDGLIATARGRIGAQLRPDGTFTASIDQIFSGNQYLAADLLTDEQNRRRLELQHLLSNPKRMGFPNEPVLIFFTEPWDLGFQFGSGIRSLGSTLVVAPLELTRPQEGSEVTIPAPLLSYRGTRGPDGSIPGGLYDYRRNEWSEKSWQSEIWLRFQIPPVLLPLTVQKATLKIQVTGPVGKLNITGARQQQLVPLKTWTDPVGTISLTIDNPDVLKTDARGGLLLRVTGGDPERPELTNSGANTGTKMNYWRLESLNLELNARIDEVSSSSKITTEK